MPKTIAINGIKLHEVSMPLVPYDKRTVSFMSYPSSQFRCTRDGRPLSLAVPVFLAVELYRSGILPQDVDIPVSVQIGGRAAGQFLVTNVRYPHSHVGSLNRVTFTLTHARQAETYIPTVTHT